MEIFALKKSRRSGILVDLRKRRKKPRVSLRGKPQLQRRMNPNPINALNALRDGTSCSERMGCERYLGSRAFKVK
jgi:hypothetical protein